MDALLQDLRFALRTLRRDLAFAVLLVLTLATGIGANAAVFSVVRSVLLDPLPYPEADRLAVLWSELPSEGVLDATSGYANVQDWRAQSRSFEVLATFDPITLTATDGEWPERLSGVKAAAGLLPLLGVAPAMGRTFSEAEERALAPVAVIGDALWRRRFAGAPDALGRTVEIAGERFEVIGVMPPEFGFPDAGTDLWIPQSWFTDRAAASTERGTGSWHVAGRLRPGVSLGEARRELGAVAARLEDAHPESNAGLRVDVVGLRDQVTGGSFRLALWALFGAVGLVLLMASANAAHMILARGMGRAHELALRLSLGASTRRLVRQALTESVVIAALAGVAGLALAAVGIRLLVWLAPASLPRIAEVRLDAAVVGYAASLSLVVGMLAGSAPALSLARGRLYDALREGRTVVGGGRAELARKGLIVFQFALALVLVFGASLVVRSFVEARRVDPGFDSAGVLMANLSVEDATRRLSFYREVTELVPTIPGVAASGLIEDLFIGGASNRAIAVEGSRADRPTLTPLRLDAIAGDLFGALGAPLREGRGFVPADDSDAVPVAIVNETMARRFWPGESPVGKRFRMADGGPGAPWLKVVGVAADLRRQGPETPPIPQAFVPYAQAPSRNMVLLVRGVGAVQTQGLAAALRSRMAEVDRSVPLYGVSPLDEALGRYLLERRFQSALLGLFSVIALVLAALGIYGLLQYSVSQRTREIGVRLALGGTSAQVVGMVLRQGLSLAIRGLAVGLVAALLLSWALSALLFRASGLDPTHLLSTTAILLLTAAAACYLPARRAARVDPVTALRHR